MFTPPVMPPPIAWFKVPANGGAPEVWLGDASYSVAYSANGAHAYLTVYSMSATDEALLHAKGEEVTQAEAIAGGVA